MSTWTPPSYRLPEPGVEVNTLDSGGHEQTLVYADNLWWFPDRSMYVYYTPTFWRPLS